MSTSNPQDPCIVNTIEPTLSLGVYSIGFHFFCQPFDGVNIELLRRELLKKTELYKQSLSPFESYVQDLIPFSFQTSNLPLTGCCSRDNFLKMEITFPSEIHYVAEGRQMTLKRASAANYTKVCTLRENFTLFPSGHLGYHLMLVPDKDGGAGTWLDEYEIIALTKLFYQTELPVDPQKNLRNLIKFHLVDTKPIVGLDALVQSRLDAQLTPQHYLGQIFSMVQKKSRCSISWDSLKGGSVYLGHEEYYKTLYDFLKNSQSAEEAQAEGDNATTDPAQKVWQQNLKNTTNPDTQLHKGNHTTDVVLVLAGIAQGILDFPYISPEELQDSLEPSADKENMSVYYKMHPKMLFSLDGYDRIFVQNLGTSGSSPYRLLPQVFLLYNEVLLAEQEAGLSQLRFSDSKNIGSHQLIWMDRLYTHTESAKNKKRFHQHLRQKLEIYRDLFLNYLPNVFRYDTEKDLFDAGIAERALSTKMTVYQTNLEKFDKLLQDVDMLQERAQATRANNAARFMNGILVVIGALSLIQVREPLLQVLQNFGFPDQVFHYFVVAGVLYGVFLIIRSFFKK